MAEFFRCAVLEGNKRPTLRYTLAAARVLILAPLGASAQGALEGTIRHAGTGAVVAGARIGIPALNLGGLADPDGHYEVTGIPAGTHTVEIALIGYTTEVREVTIADGESVHLDVELHESALALEGLVALGSRARPRTATQSAVPIDAITARDFIEQGDTDLSDLLRTIIMWIGGGFADGAQGPDISTIPAIALRQVEILRDGASAQYGSDAIAGVMNLTLKDAPSGGRFFGDGLQLYGHANYASETVTGGFFFRNPNTRAGVYSLDAGQTLLVGDVLDARDGVLDGSANCPVVMITNHAPDLVALARVFEDPDCFTFQEMFPGGFTPQFGGDARDASLVAGLRGHTHGGLQWDVSGGFGRSAVDFFIRNTVNASLGPESPDSFDPGVYEQTELSLNFDLNYVVNVAGGAEFRDEHFEIGIGEVASWEIGPFAAQGFSSGRMTRR